MPLPDSGTISLNQIQTEFGGTNPIGISEYYGASDGVPASGTIALSDFYGAANFSPRLLRIAAVGGGGAGGYSSSSSYPGAGGAGGVAIIKEMTITEPTTIEIFPGRGGIPYNSNDPSLNLSEANGGATTFVVNGVSYIADGGGGGASRHYEAGPGGGGSRYFPPGTRSSGGTTGGKVFNSKYACGGGAGAGGSGYDAPKQAEGGQGGLSKSWDYFGNYTARLGAGGGGGGYGSSGNVGGGPGRGTSKGHGSKYPTNNQSYTMDAEWSTSNGIAGFGGGGSSGLGFGGTGSAGVVMISQPREFQSSTTVVGYPKINYLTKNGESLITYSYFFDSNYPTKAMSFSI